MNQDINLRRLWCLRTRGYHVYRSEKTPWVDCVCLYCGFFPALTKSLDPYTYQDGGFVYSISQPGRIFPDTATEIAKWGLTPDSEFDIVMPKEF